MSTARLERNYWRIGGWTAAALLLLMPLVAMQFTSEVNWGRGDFLVAGLMIGTAGLAFELVVRLTRDRRTRIVAGLLIAAVFLLTWVELAVGIFH